MICLLFSVIDATFGFYDTMHLEEISVYLKIKLARTNNNILVSGVALQVFFSVSCLKETTLHIKLH